MKFSDSHPAAASVEDVFAARSEVSVREAACQASGALTFKVEIATDQGVTTVRIDRVLPPNVPAVARSFVGDSISVQQTERWVLEPTTGARRAEVAVSIVGTPVSMHGTTEIIRDGAGSIELVHGEVKVAIPLFGRQIEPEIAKVILAALHLDQEAGEKWLAGRS